jgi:tetratricopeptide (TPR) repeat protein
MNAKDYDEIIAKAQKNIEQANFREAQSLLEETLRQADWPTESRAKVYLYLGQIGLRLGNFNAALLNLRNAQKRAIYPSWVSLEAIRVEGIVLSEKGEFEAALERFETALKLARKLKIEKSIAASLNNIALIYEYRGEFERALEIFDEGLAIAVDAEDKEESGKILNNMAEIFAKRGQYDLAYEHYYRALILDKERGDRAGEAIGLNNISEIYKAMGNYAKSIEYLQKAYDLVNEIGYKPMLGVVLSNLGELHWLEGDLRKASEILEQGINVCKEIGIEDETYWRMLLLLTGVQTDRENYEEAEALLDACETLNKRIRSKLLAAEAYYLRGYLEGPETGKGNLGNAKEAYHKALEIAEHEKLGFTEIWINSSLGLAHTLLGEFITSLDDQYLYDAEKRLEMIFERARQELQVPILCKIRELQGLLALAQMKHEDAIAKFEEARKMAESRGLSYLAEKAQAQHEKAVQMHTKRRKILAKDPETVQDVVEYVKGKVREVQRMIQTFGSG